MKNSARCTGANALHHVLVWVARRFPHVDTVVDPFCGAGTVLAVGNALGFHGVGIDISARRVKQATSLEASSLLEADAKPRLAIREAISKWRKENSLRNVD